jgi:hypothetical protein
MNPEPSKEKDERLTLLRELLPAIMGVKRWVFSTPLLSDALFVLSHERRRVKIPKAILFYIAVHYGLNGDTHEGLEGRPIHELLFECT